MTLENEGAPDPRPDEQAEEKVCPRCAEKVKAAALVCRFCNHEFGKPVISASQASQSVHASAPRSKPLPPPKKSHPFAFGCLAIFVLLILVGLLSPHSGDNSTTSSDSGASSPQTADCSSDWTKCSDNAQLVNSYSDWTGVQAACQVEAENEAKYGTPKWPWLSFGSFLKGDSYIHSGIAVAIEPNAQFQNGFGAMVHSTVTCKYDLNAKKVVDVSIEAN
jgi:hypothetical protein